MFKRTSSYSVAVGLVEFLFVLSRMRIMPCYFLDTSSLDSEKTSIKNTTSHRAVGQSIVTSRLFSSRHSLKAFTADKGDKMLA